MRLDKKKAKLKHAYVATNERTYQINQCMHPTLPIVYSSLAQGLETVVCIDGFPKIAIFSIPEL